MEFDESKHPRDESGRFTDKSVSDMSAAELKEKLAISIKEAEEKTTDDEPEDLTVLMGEEFTGYKGQSAVDKLMQERRGHVKGAFHRDDIGDIDLLWGNESMGLQHILQRREAQGIDSLSFIQNIAEVTEKGVFHKKNDRGNFEFWHRGKMVVVAPEFHGNKLTFLLTAYKRTKK